MAQNPRHPRLLDLRGKKFFELTVIREIEPDEFTIKSSPAGKTQIKRRWLCRCTCGGQTHSRQDELLSGRTRSCGCLRRKEMSAHPIGRKEPGSSYIRYKFSYYRRNAEIARHTFQLSLEDFKSITAQNCHYCGQIPEMPRNPSTRWARRVYNETVPCNGIDRADSSEGYSKENCVPCCHKCNIAKHKMSAQEFAEWLSQAYHHFAEHHPTTEDREGSCGTLPEMQPDVGVGSPKCAPPVDS